MSTRRVSFDIDEEEHKNLKSYCAQLGLSIKELVIKAINDKVQHNLIKDHSKKEYENKEEE